MPVLFPLEEANLGFHPSFSRHGRDQASLSLLIWLNENLHFGITAYNRFSPCVIK